MLNALIIADDGYKFKELESLLLSDFHIDYTNKLKSTLSEMSKLEFNYDMFFLLKEPSYDEISAVNRLAKNKVLIYQTKNLNSWISFKYDTIPVYDYELNLSDARKVILNASNMVGRIKYYKNVEKIVIVAPFHVNLGWEVILNGNKTTKAMIGDLAVRTSKDVILGQRNENFVFFSGDVLSDDAMKLDNKKFISNLIEDMLEGVEMVE